eukprot:TRINITY_DN56808_c0_g1_i2.p1 TRINITY_DN56808_c0_g1~~TRINITY_DN56808_c0_g1_i2.p1  ORF type:complete len:116 (+),score=1.44 TRINITY_DN56808_c0_g1_i2:1-348(+)
MSGMPREKVAKVATPWQVCLTAIVDGNFKHFELGLKALPKEEINHKDDTGNTLLHWAVAYQRIPFAKYLISHGADSSLQNVALKTPLQIAKDAIPTDLSFIPIKDYLLSTTLVKD